MIVIPSQNTPLTYSRSPMNSSDSLAIVPTTGLGIDAISAQYLAKTTDIFEILVASSSDYHQLIVNNFTVFERFCLRRLHNREQVTATRHAMMFSYITSGKLLEIEQSSKKTVGELAEYLIEELVEEMIEVLANKFTEGPTEYAEFLAISRQFQRIDRENCAIGVVKIAHDLLLNEPFDLIDTQVDIRKLRGIWFDLMATNAGIAVKNVLLDARYNDTKFGALLAVELFDMLLEPLMLGVFVYDDLCTNYYRTNHKMQSILDKFKIFVHNVLVYAVPEEIWKPVFDRFVAAEMVRRSGDIGAEDEFRDNVYAMAQVITDTATVLVHCAPQMANVDVETTLKFVHYYATKLFLDVCSGIRRDQIGGMHPQDFVDEYVCHIIASFPEDVGTRLFHRFDPTTLMFVLESVNRLRESNIGY